MGNTEDLTLRIKADDREAKKLAQTIKKAFDPTQAKEMRVATRDLERQYGDVVKRQSAMIAQLEKVSKGTEAYKNLKKELKGVSSEARLVSTALTQIDKAQSRLSRQQQSSSGRNFLAGMSQGTGLAQYMPSGAGMGARMVGAGVGGMMRRGVGAAAAPFTTPGVSGMIQGLSNIPGVGGFAAMSLGAAAGAVGSATGFDRARLANLHFAGPQLGQTIISRKKGMAAMSRAQAEKRADEIVKLSAVRDEGLGQASPTSAAGISASILRERGFTINRKAAAGSPKIIAPGGRAATAGESALMNEAALGMQDPSVSFKQQDYLKAQKKKLVSDLMKGRAARTMSGLGPIGLGGQLGFDPTQVQGMMGQFFGQRGGTADRRAGGGLEAFRESMVAQSRFGVSQSQSGQFGRMFMPGGGGAGAGGPGALTKVLQGAFVEGLRGAQITEYLSELVNLGQASEKQGIKINVSEFQKTTMQLRGAGIEGPQRGRIAAGLLKGGQNLAASGVQTPMQMLMLRAAGFQPGQGPEAYATAMKKVEAGGADYTGNLLSSIVEGTAGLSPNLRELQVKRALGQAGVSVGFGQAGKFIKAGDAGDMSDVSALIAERDAMGGQAGAAKRARRAVNIAAPTAVGAAGLEASRISLGKRMAGAVFGMEQNAIKAGGVIANFSGSISNLNEVIGKVISGLETITKGGLAGIQDRIANLLMAVDGAKLMPKGS